MSQLRKGHFRKIKLRVLSESRVTLMNRRRVPSSRVKWSALMICENDAGRVLPRLLPSLLFFTPHFHSSFRVHPREELQPSSTMSSDVQLRDRTDPLTTCDRESGDPAGVTSDWEQVGCKRLHRTTVRAFSALPLVCGVFYTLFKKMNYSAQHA